MTAPTYFKSLAPGAISTHGGEAQWHTPRGKRPGKWMPRVADPRCCVRGYHVCTISEIIEWLAPEIWVVEVRGSCDFGTDKSAWGQARLIRRTYWNDRVARHFAADCAERVLPLFEAVCPDDSRPRDAIRAARDFADGRISDVARAAAWDAAWDVARAAAWDAAWDAARAAARDAARDAARAAAWDAERRWQSRRLRSYLLGSRGEALQ